MLPNVIVSIAESIICVTLLIVFAICAMAGFGFIESLIPKQVYSSKMNGINFNDRNAINTAEGLVGGILFFIWVIIAAITCK